MNSITLLTSKLILTDQFANQKIEGIKIDPTVKRKKSNQPEMQTEVTEEAPEWARNPFEEPQAASFGRASAPVGRTTADTPFLDSYMNDFKRTMKIAFDPVLPKWNYTALPEIA